MAEDDESPSREGERIEELARGIEWEESFARRRKLRLAEARARMEASFDKAEALLQRMRSRPNGHRDGSRGGSRG